MRNRRVNRPSARNCRTGGKRGTRRAVGALNNGCIGNREGLDAFALTGGKNGGNHAEQRRLKQVFFHNRAMPLKFLNWIFKRLIS